jgi:hypothetical protein
MPFTKVALTLNPKGFSFSQLKIATKCPFQYVKRYVEREKPTNETDLTSANIGRIAHAIFEKALLLAIENDIEPTALNIMEIVSEACEAVALMKHITEHEYNGALGYENSIVVMLNRILLFQRRTGAKLYPELKLAISKDFEPVDFDAKNVFFRAVLDLVLVQENGAVAIVDHKTGYRTTKPYLDQLKVYEILTAFALAPKLFQEDSIQVKTIRAGLCFLEYEEMWWSDSKHLNRITEDGKNWFIDWINDISDSAITGQIKRGSHCNRCGYRSFCGSKVGTRKKKKTSEVTM